MLLVPYMWASMTFLARVQTVKIKSRDELKMLVLLPSIYLHVCFLGTALRQRWRSR